MSNMCKIKFNDLFQHKEITRTKKIFNSHQKPIKRKKYNNKKYKNAKNSRMNFSFLITENFMLLLRNNIFHFFSSGFFAPTHNSMMAFD